VPLDLDVVATGQRSKHWSRGEGRLPGGAGNRQQELIGNVPFDGGDTTLILVKIIAHLSGYFAAREAVAKMIKSNPTAHVDARDVRIPPIGLAGTLRIPGEAHAFIAFAHGSGSSRFSPRNMAVAEGLNAHGFGTLLFDLLTSEEEADRANVFNIALLAERLVDVINWLDRDSSARGRPLGLFGASTGAAAALVAAARLGDRIGAVVSRGGRPDLAGDALDQIRTPTLLIVGGADYGVIELNEQALARLKGPKALQIVPGATHLFPEAGALEAVIDYAGRWFARYLRASSSELVSRS
jgi:putative phosphoribosyl transferase